MSRMFERIAALKLTGCGLMFGNREIMDQIVLISSGMIIGSSQKAKIKGEFYEGMIVTNFQSGMVGSLGGMRFDISLETDKGPVSLDFVLTRPINEAELKSRFWFDYPADMDGEEILNILEEYFRSQGYEGEAAQH